MSRVGKKPIDIPAKVKVEIKDSLVNVQGPKGALEHEIPGRLTVEVKDNKIIVKRSSDEKSDIMLHGLTRSVLFNLVKGVTEGYSKELEIKGVGFKAQAQGKSLQISLGFSHPVVYSVPDGVEIKTPKPTQISVSGADKVKVGEVAAEIRSFFQPEPYTGKGIRYAGEYVRHKAGKTVVK